MTIIDGNSTSSSSESTSPKISKRKPRKNNNRRASQNNNNNNNNNSNNNHNNNNNSNNNNNNNNNSKMTSNTSANSNKVFDTTTRFRALEPPLRQHTKLNVSEKLLITYLKDYILDETLQRQLGFPMEYDCAPNLAIIYKYPPYEFIPLRKRNNTKQLVSPASAFLNRNDGLSKGRFGSDNTDSDSGQGSGSSSPSSGNEYHVNGTASSLNRVLHEEPIIVASSEKECSRCGEGFFVTENGDYLLNEACFYHTGKLYKTFDNKSLQSSYVYTCCNRGAVDSGSNGCCGNRHHVWSGLSSGMNGPYEGYVRTQQRPLPMPEDGNTGVFAVDCEMCYTGCGLELTKVTIVRSDGNLFYETYVRPDREIVDYNTRFSGITEKDLVNNNTTYNNTRRTSNTSSRSSNSSFQSHDCERNVKTLNEVQKDLLKFIFDDTILIGHGIENDLKALKLIHKTVIDTSIAFPHHSGLPFRRSLKSLTKCFLKRDIQESTNGHCSFEDSRACLDLILWKIRKDYRQILEQS